MELLQEAHEEDIENLKLIAKKLNNPEYSAAALATTHEYQKVKELEAQVKEEEAARVQAEEEKRRLEEELEIERQKNTYLTATRKTLSEDAEGLVTRNKNKHDQDKWVKRRESDKKTSQSRTYAKRYLEGSHEY